ncbi:stress response translation initiation inhibitor YciH [Candidatus Woesearchaeota archaeon]|nr:stress response translation initiation inhibitor YciH [Candidatus Woesearchaeota archaeon]
MSEVCQICGLPKDLCVCESIAKERQRIVVKIEKRKFRKHYTIIAGIDKKEINIKDLVKMLKNKLACGGTVKDGKIELQGNHKSKVKPILVGLGFPPETIDIE